MKPLTREDRIFLSKALHQLDWVVTQSNRMGPRSIHSKPNHDDAVNVATLAGYHLARDGQWAQIPVYYLSKP